MTEKIELSMIGGAPWGFRLQGGGRTQLFVHKVRPKSRSSGHLREGDLIVSVNGQDCENMTYDDVLNIVENCGDNLKMQVMREVYKEGVPPSEIARQQGYLKPRRKKSSKATAECYERSFVSPDGTNVQEESFFRSSEVHSGVSDSSGNFGPVSAWTKIEKLPDDVIKRSSLARSPIFDQKTEISKFDDKVEVKTTKTTRTNEKKGNVLTKTFTEEKEIKVLPSKETKVQYLQTSNETSTEKNSKGVEQKAPTTIEEFKKTTESFEKTNVNSSIEELEKFPSKSTSSITKDRVILKNNDDKTKEKNYESLPKDHMTRNVFSDVEDIQRVNGATTMPGVTQKYSAPLFQVSNFRTETKSSYSWNPQYFGQYPEDTVSCDVSKRSSTAYDTRPVPPPPPPKPPRPLSAPNLESKILNFSDQIRQEICTPERRSFAEEGKDNPKVTFSDQIHQHKYAKERRDAQNREDRRSASLEMIRKALIPPSEEELKETLITRTKKKMFSSSSFYEEPKAIYPTVEEQFDLAQKIASSLSDENNKKSKGADMFNKRVNRSNKWIHESPNREITEIEVMTTSESINDRPPVETKEVKVNGVLVEDENMNQRSKLKPVLNPVRPIEPKMFLGTDREFKAQGLAMSPDVCADLVQDLNNSKGKGATIFAKRRKKSEKWVVGDSKVPTKMAEPPLPSMAKASPPPQNRLQSMIEDNHWNHQRIKYIKSPWEAALESPVGNCDAAFEIIKYKRPPNLPPPPPTEVIKARLPSMLNIEASGISRESASPQRSNLYKPKAPRGWAKSVHDPTAAELMSASYDIENYPQSDSEGFSKSKPAVGNYNTLPRSWGRSKKESTQAYRPVRTSLYS